MTLLMEAPDRDLMASPPKIVEYYRPAPAGDANVGAGYGTTKSKGLGSEYSREATYPYRMDSSEEEDDLLLDIEAFIEEEGLNDLNLVSRIMNKSGTGYISPDSVKPRADRSGFATGQRFDLAPLSETERIPVRKGDRMHGSISPIPFSALYKGFTGPALGGSSNSFAYRTAPGRKSGTQYGTSRAPEATEDDGIRVFSADDIPDPDIRTIFKTRSKIKKVLSEFDF